MKKIVYIVLVGLLAAILFLLGMIYFKEKDTVAVLCYHNIATLEEKNNFPEEAEFTIDVNNFEEHLKFLKKHNYKTLTMEEFIKWKEGKLKIPLKSVLITFDDGFLSNYEYAFPLLKKYNMNATVFVVGEFSNLANEVMWNGNIKTYMSNSLIQQAKEEFPNIDFCSHTYNLHYENSINENTLEQIKEDLLKYEEEYGKTESIAYPFGARNDSIKSALKEIGYKVAFIYGPTKNEFRKANKNDDNYEIPRLNVSHGMPIWKFLIRLWI